MTETIDSICMLSCMTGNDVEAVNEAEMGSRVGDGEKGCHVMAGSEW